MFETIEGLTATPQPLGDCKMPAEKRVLLWRGPILLAACFLSYGEAIL